MNQHYWDRMSQVFDQEIFNVSKHDVHHKIAAQIGRLGSPRKTAIDLGCGVGRFIPFLAEAFGRVHATDFSRSCIRRAQADCARWSNVEYLVCDYTKPQAKLPRYDFGLCVNSLIMPSLQERITAIDAITRHLIESGHLLVVVPSLESSVLTNFRLIQWNLRNGLSPSAAVRSGFGTPKSSADGRLHQGIVSIDGVSTKHYLEEEICILLQEKNLKVLSIEKLEYQWDTEFERPPRWMTQPYPWDWFVLARKGKRDAR